MYLEDVGHKLEK